MEFTQNNFPNSKYCLDPNKINVFAKPKKTSAPYKSEKPEKRKLKRLEKRKNKIVKL